MIHAYDKVYLEKARVALGRMLDFAVYDLRYDIAAFFDLFIQSGVASRFEMGDYAVTVGMSGVELAYLVLEKSDISVRRVAPRYTVDRSMEYWTGWALAYYQWETAMRFSEIIHRVSIRDIAALYSPYHEMDIRQFVDKMHALYRIAQPETNLKCLRRAAHLTQRALSEMSGVPLRTIQQYEQRRKYINKAQGEHLTMLAQALCCRVEDLLEKTEPASPQSRGTKKRAK